LWGIAALMAAEPKIHGIMTHYKVSDSEVVKVEGILRKKRHSIPHQGIGQVRVSKGILGRILNYGTVEVEGQNESSTIAMRHVRNPDDIRRVIREKIDSYKVAPGKRSSTKKHDEPKDEDEHIEEEGDGSEEE